MPETLSWRPVPPSLPAAVPWPPTIGPVTPGAGQPPLPWSATAGNPDAGVTGPSVGRPRTIRYGDSWAADPPDRVPDPEAWAGRIAGALLETLQGRRPLGQLSRWLDAPVLARLAWMTRRPLDPAALGTVHLNRVGSSVIEVVAVARPPERPATTVCTMAFRLQVLGDRWLCTALELLPAVARPAGAVDRGRSRA